MSFAETVKFSWTKILLTLICLLEHNIHHFKSSYEQSPIWLLGFPPVVEAEHDGEGAGGQQLPSVLVLLVLVVQAVSRCQSESVSNLGRKRQKFEKLIFFVFCQDIALMKCLKGFKYLKSLFVSNSKVARTH